jgi:hypothetical protein
MQRMEESVTNNPEHARFCDCELTSSKKCLRSFFDS